jgi:hypothetical protein
LYKILIIFYFLCFFFFVLFTRVPDYFEGDYAKGVVSKAAFSEVDGSPELLVNYKVGAEIFHYKTDTWFLSSYKKGEIVTVIYNPANPSVCCIYAFIGYWIKWSELIFTSTLFFILFIAAKSITGRSNQDTFFTARRNGRFDE